jgi:hypothetical protein
MRRQLLRGTRKSAEKNALGSSPVYAVDGSSDGLAALTAGPLRISVLRRLLNRQCTYRQLRLPIEVVYKPIVKLTPKAAPPTSDTCPSFQGCPTSSAARDCPRKTFCAAAQLPLQHQRQTFQVQPALAEGQALLVSGLGKPSRDLHQV